MPGLQLISPSRLHFGLLSFNNPNVPQFGGLGMMIDGPNLELRARQASSFKATGTHSDRVEQFAKNWSEFHKLSALPRVEFEVVSAPRQHIGLGLGTQLGLSVGRLLSSLLLERTCSIEELAKSVSRGKRSSVGTLGFVSGGLIFERGKTQADTIAVEQTRVELPEDWRIVLITRKTNVGLSGKTEQSAFDRLPPVPEETTKNLIELATEKILPSTTASRFAQFSDGLYRYGEIAGSCFASLQGGSFADKNIEMKINAIRDCGVLGVGQSSWGPTIFSFHKNEEAALEFSNVAMAMTHFDDCELTIASPNKIGHQLIEIE